jgi:hypothetical protein
MLDGQPSCQLTPAQRRRHNCNWRRWLVAETGIELVGLRSRILQRRGKRAAHLRLPGAWARRKRQIHLRYVAAPQISLPKGGGAIRGIDEKFTANPVTGTGSLAIQLPLSPGRSGFGPSLSLAYDSGGGNGIFGMGWAVSTPSITRRTDKGIPLYRDAEESDIFILSGAEDLVPVLGHNEAGRARFDEVERDGYRIRYYRPRVEGLFARIERWTHIDTGEAHWRSFSRDNILTVYGLDAGSRIADPAAPNHVFSWLICRLAPCRSRQGHGLYVEALDRRLTLNRSARVRTS